MEGQAIEHFHGGCQVSDCNPQEAAFRDKVKEVFLTEEIGLEEILLSPSVTDTVQCCVVQRGKGLGNAFLCFCTYCCYIDATNYSPPPMAI